MSSAFPFQLSRNENREYYFDRTTTPWTLYSRVDASEAWAVVLEALGQGQTLTAGFTETSGDLGTVTTGEVELDIANGHHQVMVNNGAHTLTPQTANSEILLLVTNDASAGAVTTSGYDHVIGDTLTTTDEDVALCRSLVIGGVSILVVTAVLNN